MATGTPNFAALLSPGLVRIYGDSYKEYPEQYSQFFNVESSTKAFEDSLSMSGLSLVPVKLEGKGIDYDSPIQGPTNRLTHVTYGKGFIVTREMFEDDLYKKIRNLPKALARSVRVTIETTAANVPNRAFSGSYLGADGKSLCATDHPLLGGGTFSNTLSTAADLDMTSLEQALIDVSALVDDRGLPIQARATKLIIPMQLEWQSKRLLKSVDDPETANRSINPAVGSLSEGYAVNHYLTDPDAWFLKTDVPNGLVFYWRRRPAFAEDNDFDSENGKWKTTYRMSVGWDDPRGIYGSPGA